ncbi:helix-turn-helix domain-containing protein [Rhodobacter sp. HX-7-19]|uniref:Helix-turn-helix domain-containing protein n=1 Tax=Paragemmobacter kunshanensis TaxID=2583234 RepID=A0A6M1U979_9RHOB|nr:helix-turn-helix domain-containing protein [Rhodobacter kunshanensis]NGQ93275.1 helix-turn-helix domain-containing protein [Rhodobacter kunshanensis]
MAKVRIFVLVEPGFVATELSLALDVFRIANRLQDDADFEVTVCTSSGQTLVESLDETVMVRATPFQSEAFAQPGHLVVLGGRGIRAALGGLRSRLCWIERTGSHVLLLSDAASEWMRLHPQNTALTTHWENQQLLRDTLVNCSERPTLYARSGRITTAAGMIATADVVLGTIVATVSNRLAQALASILLMDRIREDATPQPRSENDSQVLRLAKLDTVIRHMEQNVETPVSIEALAEISGTSVRQLERKFKAATRCAPMPFYRSLRLRRSKALVEQTTLSITDIMIACGFGSSSHFSRMFFREFGTTPSQLRRDLLAEASSPLRVHPKKGSHHAPVSFPAPAPGPSAYGPRTDGAAVQGAWG